MPKRKEKKRREYKRKKEDETSSSSCFKGFIPPTVTEVAEYCESRNNGIDAEEFVSFYNSKDWYIGKNKMKSWTDAVMTWEKRNKTNNQGSKKVKEEPKGRDF